MVFFYQKDTMPQTYTIPDNKETTKRSIGRNESDFICGIKGLKAQHRELYAIIDALCSDKKGPGFCFAWNLSLAEILRVSESSIKRYLRKLEELNCITLEFDTIYKRKIWSYEAIVKQNLYFENSGLAEDSQEKFLQVNYDLTDQVNSELPKPKQENPLILETKSDLKEILSRSEMNPLPGQFWPLYLDNVSIVSYKDSSSSLACSSNTRRPDIFLNDKDKAKEQAVENEIEESEVVEAKELFGKFVRISRTRYSEMCNKRSKVIVDRYVEKANRQFDRWEDKGRRCEDHAALIEKWMTEDLGKADGNKVSEKQLIEFRNTQAQADQRKSDTEEMIEQFFIGNQINKDQYFWQKHASRLILFYPKNEKYSDENFQYGPNTKERLSQWLNRLKEIKGD